jgi:hypothetical protein
MAFAEFFRDNEKSFKLLCPYDFSESEDVEAAKSEFKKLVEDFIELQKNGGNDKKDLPLLLGKISYLFQNLPFETFENFFESKEEDEKIIANLLNFVVSVYCKNVLKRNFFIEVANENARVCQREYDIYKLQHEGVFERLNATDVKSEILQDPKIRAVRKRPANRELVLLHRKEYDGRKHIYNKDLVAQGKMSQDDALSQIANLAVGLNRYTKIPNFSLCKELIKISDQLSEESIDHETRGMKIKILPALCEIFSKAQKKTEPKLGITDFKTFVSKIKPGSIRTSDHWKIIVEYFDPQGIEGLPEGQQENYSQQVVDLPRGQVLNSEELISKTLSLIKNKSLDCDHFFLLVEKIEDPATNFGKKENLQELFKKYKYVNIASDLDKIINHSNKFFGLQQIHLDRDIFIEWVKILKQDPTWFTTKNKFGFFPKSIGATFVCECNDEEQEDIKRRLGETW